MQPHRRFGDVANVNGWLGDCLTGEYDVAGGKVQDFRFGRVFSSDGTTVPVGGAIGGAYQGVGGPAGQLGYPTTEERVAPDGRGRFNHFRNGAIYWTPEHGAHAVRGKIFEEWKNQGWEGGPLGYPILDEAATPDGRGAVQASRSAPCIGARTPAPRRAGHDPRQVLPARLRDGSPGLPDGQRAARRRDGRFNEFQHGNIYWSPLTGAWPVRGKILEAWLAEKGAEGRLGLPISDEFPAVDGKGVQQNFQNGFITLDGDEVKLQP